jgi:hypothetical protein
MYIQFRHTGLYKNSSAHFLFMAAQASRRKIVLLNNRPQILNNKFPVQHFVLVHLLEFEVHHCNTWHCH